MTLFGFRCGSMFAGLQACGKQWCTYVCHGGPQKKPYRCVPEEMSIVIMELQAAGVLDYDGGIDVWMAMSCYCVDIIDLYGGGPGQQLPGLS